jgi:hypothetical protein
MVQSSQEYLRSTFLALLLSGYRLGFARPQHLDFDP